jgi:hypothetical protein
MAALKEFYCRSNENGLGSQFKWLEYTFKSVFSVGPPQVFFIEFYREVQMQIVRFLKASTQHWPVIEETTYQ